MTRYTFAHASVGAHARRRHELSSCPRPVCAAWARTPRRARAELLHSVHDGRLSSTGGPFAKETRARFDDGARSAEWPCHGARPGRALHCRWLESRSPPVLLLLTLSLSDKLANRLAMLRLGRTCHHESHLHSVGARSRDPEGGETRHRLFSGAFDGPPTFPGHAEHAVAAPASLSAPGSRTLGGDRNERTCHVPQGHTTLAGGGGRTSLDGQGVVFVRGGPCHGRVTSLIRGARRGNGRG